MRSDRAVRYTRLIGLLVFLLAVVAIQVAESLYLWYSYREERLQLVELRELLVDEGAAMIRAQLQAEEIRRHIADMDSLISHRRLEVAERREHHGVGALRAVYAWEVEGFTDQVLERNQRLNQLSSAVHERNSAAARYYVLADSIRSLAARAGEPYFSVPIPAQAAAERGITRETESPASDEHVRSAETALRGDE